MRSRGQWASPAGQDRRRAAWGIAVRGAAPVMILLLFAALAACGGGGDDDPADGPGNGTPGTNGEATATGDAASVEALGDQVTQFYFAALDDLELLLGRGLPPDSLRTEVRSLKDEYIAIFVPYGQRREAMSEADRETFDTRVRLAVTLSTPAALDAVNTATATLIEDGETELADEIRSFNIITQYVFFDLLKAQEPEEARRLGIP